MVLPLPIMPTLIKLFHAAFQSILFFIVLNRKTELMPYYTESETIDHTSVSPETIILYWFLKSVFSVLWNKSIAKPITKPVSFLKKKKKSLLQPQTINTSGYRHELTAHIFYLSLELHQNSSYNYSISKSSFGVSHLVESPWQCEKPVKLCKSMFWLFWFCLRSQKKSFIIVKNETFDIQVISRMASIFLNNELHWILTSQQMLII